VTLDDSFDPDDDMKLDVDGLTVVIERTMRETLENVVVSFDRNTGIVVSRQPL